MYIRKSVIFKNILLSADVAVSESGLLWLLFVFARIGMLLLFRDLAWCLNKCLADVSERETFGLLHLLGCNPLLMSAWSYLSY